MSAYGHGRHEHGQNFLTNHKIINSIIDLVKQTSGPIMVKSDGVVFLPFVETSSVMASGTGTCLVL